MIKKPALIPFLMLGDPTPELSLGIIQSVIDAGIDAIELGIPFSDPVADGPIICKASQRARQNNITLKQIFKMLTIIRENNSDLPIGLLVYANLVYQYGITDFYHQAQASGVDAVLLPDVPSEEGAPFALTAKKHHIDPILLATHACQEKDLVRLAELCKGFTYVVTRKGVTGTHLPSEFVNTKTLVEKLALVNAPPPVFGFGIKDASDIVRAYESGAKGVIIGSSLIKAISEIPHENILLKEPITTLVRKLFET